MTRWPAVPATGVWNWYGSKTIQAGYLARC
jgi:hypothetical protein